MVFRPLDDRSVTQHSHGTGISRREFALGAAMAAWPVSTLAQSRIRRVGVMMVNAESDRDGHARLGVFRDRLRALGWVEGGNLRVDYRWEASNPARAKTAAAELLALAPDVILANGTPAVAELKQATRDVPVVFVVVTDPVGAGLVESFARPGANITGFSTFEPEIGGKWLELLKEIAPGLRRVAGILDPGFKSFAGVWRTVEELAPKTGIAVTSVAFRNPADDIESAVASFAQQPGGGLIVLPTAINNMARSRIFAAAARHRLPAVYPFRFFAVDGGLMSYGFDPPDLFRRGAEYVDRILKGEKPGDLPVQAPTKYQLIVNLKTAKAIALTVPPSLLARADEVIE
jgi:putative ABC transport system substrate-binding protein